MPKTTNYSNFPADLRYTAYRVDTNQDAEISPPEMKSALAHYGITSSDPEQLKTQISKARDMNSQDFPSGPAIISLAREIGVLAKDNPPERSFADTVLGTLSDFLSGDPAPDFYQ